MLKEWKVNIGNFERLIVYEANKKEQQYSLFVDGIRTEILETSLVPIFGIDHSFEIDGTVLRILDGAGESDKTEHVELVVDGIRVEKQKRYYSLKMFFALYILSVVMIIMGAILFYMNFNCGADTIIPGMAVVISSIILLRILKTLL